MLSIPISPRDFSLHYSGSLAPMDLTRLNGLLENAEHLCIKSGAAQAATFDIDVHDGHAHGNVRAIYRDLKIAVLDKTTGKEAGLDNRISSLLVNVFKVRNDKGSDALGGSRDGKVSYTRAPQDTFLKFLWFALRSGVLDAIGQ
jgi:hypothetical protein